MSDPDPRHIADLWIAAYEEIAKTLRALPDPITLPPVVLGPEMLDRMIDAAAEAAASLYDRDEEPGAHRFLADALLFWLAACDVLAWRVHDADDGWRTDAILVVLRQAVAQATTAAEWLRDGPPTPPPPDHTLN